MAGTMVPVSSDNTGQNGQTGPDARKVQLAALAAEIEGFVAAGGWDRAPVLFALVPTRLLAGDPNAVAVLGGEGDWDPESIAESALTPIAQEELPEGPLDEALAQIGWPDEVAGCALSQEIVMLPPEAEQALDELSGQQAVVAAAEHPERREARLVIAVLRDGTSAGVLRLRSLDAEPDDLLTGDELAPNLVAALMETFTD